MLRKSFVMAVAALIFLGSSDCQRGQVKSDSASADASRQVNREEILSQTVTPVFTYRIIRIYPHQTTSYTEGLQMHDGYLFEGTGRYGQSNLMRIELTTGKVLQRRPLESRYFGEGITIFQDSIYQLTYRSKVGFIYDKDSFNLERVFHYSTQGWGLTTDGRELIMSNGSSLLIFMDPKTLQPIRHLTVSDGKREIRFLNELEYVDGEILANVWKTDFIVKISPRTGRVTGWIDLTGIDADQARRPYPYTPNGIGYDEKSGHLLITGKCWSNLYEIALVPVHARGHLFETICNSMQSSI